MKKNIILLLLLLIYFFNAESQTWTPLEMHSGGKVTGLIGHPTDENIMYCRTDVAGIYKSVNKGDKWEQLLLNVPKYSDHIFKIRSFVVNPNNASELFFASGNSPSGDQSGIWKSTDEGVTWSLKTEIAAFSGNGNYRWADEVMVIKPTNTNVLFAGSQPKIVAGTAEKGGIITSNDGGESWSKLNLPVFNNKWITKLLFDPTNDDIIYIAAAKSGVNGLAITGGLWSYNQSNQALIQLTTNDVVDVDFDAVDKNKMIAVGDLGVFISGDKGTTWSAPTKPFGYTYESFVTPHPTETNHWFFGGKNGFFSNGFVETTDALSTTYFTTYGSKNSTNYNKITWPSYAAENTNTQPVFGGSLSNLFFNSLRPSTAYFNNVWRCDNATGLLVDPTNTDKNKNANWDWTFKSEGIYIMVGIRVSPHPTNEDIYTLNVADVNQYETIDNGGDMLFYGLMKKLNYSAVTCYAPSNPNIRYSGGVDNLGNGTLNKLADGNDWVEMASSFFDGSKVIQDIQVDPTNPEIVIVGLENSTLPSQIYISEDGGTQWNRWDTGLAGESFFKKWEAWSRLIQDKDGETYYTWNKNKVFKRGINEASWQEITLPLNTPIRRLTTARDLPGRLYIVYGQSNQLYISKDYGLTWNAYALPYVNDSEFVSVSPNGRVIVARRFNFNSKREFQMWINDAIENGGVWEPLSLVNYPSTTKDVTFLNEERVVSISRGHGSYLAEIPMNPLSVSTIEKGDNYFSIFPNPSSGLITLQLKKGLKENNIDIEIYSVNGSKISHFNRIISENKLNINVSELASGLYFITLKQDNVSKGVYKFIKS